MKQFFLPSIQVIIMIMLLGMAISCGNNDNSNENDKSSSIGQGTQVFIANEADGTVSVIDLQDSLKTTSINLSDGTGTMFMAHNVQVAPDGQSVWVAGMDSSQPGYLIVIDPTTRTIRQRVLFGKDLHLAHVVLDDQSTNAFAGSGKTNEVIQVNEKTYQVIRKNALGANHAPHDDKFIFISLHDTKEVIQYDLKSGQITRIPLPGTVHGPVQLYASPDSKLLNAADQGDLLGRPVSNEIFIINIPIARVINTIKVGKNAHGVIASNDGLFVYVTNTIDNSVSVIDVANQKVIIG